jgi:hypothetical protein
MSRSGRWLIAGLVTLAAFVVTAWLSGALILPLFLTSSGDRWALASGIGGATAVFAATWGQWWATQADNTKKPADSRNDTRVIADDTRVGAKGRYSRYGRRTGLRRWVLAAGLAAALLAAAISYLYRGVSGHPGPPVNFIIASSATANEPAPVLSAAMLRMLQSAGEGSTEALVYVAAPGGPPAMITLTPQLPDGAPDYGPSRIVTLHRNIFAVEQAVGGQAARGPFDLLVTITAAIRAAPPPATLMVISSGLSTAGGFDLRQVGWDAIPRIVAAQLKTRGLLPDLAGYRVIFSGLGNTAGRQPALPLPEQTTLTRYWLAICQAADATSCSTDDSSRAQPTSRSTTPVPVVPVPTVGSVRGPGHSSSTPPTAFSSPTLSPRGRVREVHAQPSALAMILAGLPVLWRLRGRGCPPRGQMRMFPDNLRSRATMPAMAGCHLRERRRVGAARFPVIRQRQARRRMAAPYKNSGSQSAAGTRGPRRGGRDGVPT